MTSETSRYDTRTSIADHLKPLVVGIAFGLASLYFTPKKETPQKTATPSTAAQETPSPS